MVLLAQQGLGTTAVRVGTSPAQEKYSPVSQESCCPLLSSWKRTHSLKLSCLQHLKGQDDQKCESDS